MAVDVFATLGAYDVRRGAMSARLVQKLDRRGRQIGPLVAPLHQRRVDREQGSALVGQPVLVEFSTNQAREAASQGRSTRSSHRLSQQARLSYAWLAPEDERCAPCSTSSSKPVSTSISEERPYTGAGSFDRDTIPRHRSTQREPRRSALAALVRPAPGRHPSGRDIAFAANLGPVLNEQPRCSARRGARTRLGASNNGRCSLRVLF
jgi:hypothetical protein